MDTTMPCDAMQAARIPGCTFDGGFWGQRMTTNRARTLPTQHAQLVATGRLAALDPAHRPGDPAARHKFFDSDIAKWLEAACYSLAAAPDHQLRRQVEDVVLALGQLQQADGYLNSWFGLVYPDKRWTNLRDDHELYCAGHLMEAAVAHHQATGQTHFLEIMCRYADHIRTVFGRAPGQRRGYPGHEEIELALFKLYRATGQFRYLELARYFVDERGQAPPHYYDEEARARGEQPRGGYDYCQAHQPVRGQTRAVGHAVRAMYLYAGMADLARHDHDAALLAAGLRLWDNVVQRQMYVTGSVGASSQGERFTADHDLPEETSYCETCAAIGLVFWAQRLLHTYGSGRFADVMELALYNGVISGVSLTGDRYFYVNPLASTGGHHRQEWFGCACCPPNIARLLASLATYAYSDGQAGWVHLYAAGRAQLEVEGGAVALSVRTDYPWDGKVAITVSPETPREFALHLRLPGWCGAPRLSVAGSPVEVGAVQHDGYARLHRHWQPGDTVELELPMPVQRLRARPAVRMANGKAALRRGPLVYCLEEVDNGVQPLARLALPADAGLRVEARPDLLGGIQTICGEALMAVDSDWGPDLYRTAPAPTTRHRFTAIPYGLWDNRAPGQMLVWLREV